MARVAVQVYTVAERNGRVVLPGLGNRNTFRAVLVEPVAVLPPASVIVDGQRPD